MSDMAIGGWAAFLVFNKNKYLNRVLKLNKVSIILIYIFGILLIVGVDKWRNISYFFNIFDRLILSFFFVFVILEQSYAEKSFYKVSNFKTISKLGIYTYSLYMIHFICIYIVNKLFDILQINVSLLQVLVFQTLVSFIISLFVAYLSYNFFEKYFLNLKERFSYISK